MVYEESNGWSRIGVNKWVSSQYLADSQTDAGTPTTVRTGTVRVNTSLNVRSGPSTDYAKVGSLQNGDQVTIYDEENGWYRIGDGQWVSSQYISDGGDTTVSTKTAYVKVNTSLNVRSGPSTGYSKVGSLSNGTQVTVYEESNGWSRIGDGQWVSSQYLTSSSSGPAIHNTVGQTKVLRDRTIIYENSNLTGKTYSYLPETRVKILRNVNGSVDKIYVVKTGRTGYCYNNVYK